MSSKNFQVVASNLAEGYKSQLRNRAPSGLAPPSKNVRLTLVGQAFNRPGYTDTGWSIGSTAVGVTPIRMIQYNLTFFVVPGVGVYYRKDSDGNVYSLGITPTAGTLTTLDEFQGDIWLTNATDGAYHIFVTTLNGAVTSGANTIVVEGGTSFRSPTSGNLRIKGTNEAFNNALSGNVSGAANNGSGLIRITTSASHGVFTGCQVTIASVGGTTEANGTWTITKIDATHFDLQGSTFANAYTSGGTWTNVTTDDVFVLTGTASQNYASGETAIVVEQLSIPKGSKLFFFYERMGVIGVTSDSHSQSAPWTVFFGQFQNPNIWSNVKTFDYTTLGSDREAVGSGGRLTNAVPTANYLYVFKQDQAYYTAYSDINTSTGKTPFHLLSPYYGCVNQFCARDMNGFAVWLTQNKRVMRSQSQVVAGGAVIYPDEQFDRPIREDLLAMDDDQSSARMWYYRAKKLLFIQCKVQGVSKTFVFDNNIGVWLPPDTNKNFNDFFEIGSSLYATDATTNIVYQLETGSSDNGANIDWIIASGIFQANNMVSTADWKEIIVKGKIANPAVITYTPTVNAVDGKPKTITIADAKIVDAHEDIGAVPSGDKPIGGELSAAIMYPFYKRMQIYPSKGAEYQHRFRATGDGHSGQIDAWTVNAELFSDVFLNST